MCYLKYTKRINDALILERVTDRMKDATTGLSIVVDNKELEAVINTTRHRLIKEVQSQLGALMPVELTASKERSKIYREAFVAGAKNFKYFAERLLAEIEEKL